MSRSINFAIAGCGGIANVHAKAIAAITDARLVAVFDIAEANTAKFVQQYDAESYQSYEEMLLQPTIDVVCICTPSGLHAEQTILAAQAGKHVIVEKPMAINLQDIDQMITVCHENNVLLATILPRRVSPVATYVKQLLEDGRLGRLSLCSAYGKYYRDQRYYDSAGWRGTWAMDGGGALMNQGIHTIDLLQWLVGSVQSLYGKTTTLLRDIEVEDTGIALLQYNNGAVGVIEITTTAYNQPAHKLVIQGERGTIVIENDMLISLDIINENVITPEFEPFSIDYDGHLIQIQDMVSAIKEKRKPIVTGEDGKHALEIILATYRSSRLQQTVTL